MGSRGKPTKSNIADNESAKMSTSHEVIQGYNRIAAVDEKNQFDSGFHNDNNMKLIVENNLTAFVADNQLEMVS